MAMESTLEVTLAHFKPLSTSVGGNFKNATVMLENALESDDTYADIEVLVSKHFTNGQAVGGNFEELMIILRNFLS